MTRTVLNVTLTSKCIVLWAIHPITTSYVFFFFPPSLSSSLLSKDPLFSWLRDFQSLPTLNFKNSQTYVLPQLLGKIELFPAYIQSRQELLLPMFKFPSPNNRIPLPTNIILAIGICWNSVTSSLSFQLLFYLYCPTKQPLLLFGFLENLCCFSAYSFLCSQFHISSCRGFSSAYTAFFKNLTCLLIIQVADIFHMGSQRGKNKSMCSETLVMQYSLQGRASILLGSKNKEQSSSFQNRKLCPRTSLDSGACLVLIEAG